MPHIKSFCRYSADGEELRWVLLTSSNMSTAAWGAIQNGGISR